MAPGIASPASSGLLEPGALTGCGIGGPRGRVTPRGAGPVLSGRQGSSSDDSEMQSSLDSLDPEAAADPRLRFLEVEPFALALGTPAKRPARRVWGAGFSPERGLGLGFIGAQTDFGSLRS